MALPPIDTPLFDPKELDHLVAKGYVSVRYNTSGRLAICNYTPKGAYPQSNFIKYPALRHARGLIVDSVTGKVIARGPSKFFNLGQPEALSALGSAEVNVYDKIDGVLGIPYIDTDGVMKIATRGSFSSEYAIHATQWIHTHLTEYDRTAIRDALDFGATPFFEIVYPDSRIIVDYKGEDTLYLLGAAVSDSEFIYSPDDAASLIEWNGKVAETLAEGIRLDEIDTLTGREGVEGLVVALGPSTNHFLKVKEDEYLEIQKVKTGTTDKNLKRHFVEGTLGELIAGLPDELQKEAHAKNTHWQYLSLIVARRIEEAAQEALGELVANDKDFRHALVKKALEKGLQQRELSAFLAYCANDNKTLTQFARKEVARNA